MSEQHGYVLRWTRGHWGCRPVRRSPSGLYLWAQVGDRPRALVLMIGRSASNVHSVRWGV